MRITGSGDIVMRRGMLVRGPLKSMLSLSKGCVAYIRGGLSGLKN